MVLERLRGRLPHLDVVRISGTDYFGVLSDPRLPLANLWFLGGR